MEVNWAKVYEQHQQGWVWGESTCLTLVEAVTGRRFKWSGAKSEAKAYQAGLRAGHRSTRAYYESELKKAGFVALDQPRVGCVFLADPKIRLSNGEVGPNVEGHGDQAMMGVVAGDGFPLVVGLDGLARVIAHGGITYYGVVE